jgi:hypothetical protein
MSDLGLVRRGTKLRALERRAQKSQRLLDHIIRAAIENVDALGQTRMAGENQDWQVLR